MVNFPIIETMRFCFWKRNIHCQLFDELRINPISGKLLATPISGRGVV